MDRHLNTLDYISNHKDTKAQSNTKHEPLSPKEEEIGKKIVNAAYTVHSRLGPGLLESVYETCFCYELSKAGLNYKRQVWVPINYDDRVLESALKLDVIVEDLVICELKAVDDMNPVYKAQLLSHMKLMKKRLGYLINFNVPVIKKGIDRIIL